MGKTTALLLAILLAFGLCAPALAATGDYELLEASSKFGAGGYQVNGKEQRGFIEDFAMLYYTKPGTEYYLPLRTADFSWEKGTPRPDMTPGDNNRLGIRVEVSYIQGAEAFDKIAVVTRGDTFGLLLDFADSYPHLDALEFEAECRFTQGGGMIEGAEFTVAGTLQNQNRTVYTVAKEVPLGPGRMATGYADHYGILFDLGAGVTLTGDLLWGQKVYGAADWELTQADRELMAKQPKLLQAVHLETVGLKGRVRIDPGQAGELQVYALDMTWLGTTSGTLPLERVYYLAAEKL